MQQVFDMQQPDPTLDVLDRHQQVNNEALLSVAQGMIQALDDRQHANARDIETVAQKMHRFITGIQNNNSKLLRTVVNQLQGSIDAAQAANAAALSTMPQSVTNAVTRTVQQQQASAQTLAAPTAGGSWYCVPPSIDPSLTIYLTPDQASSLSSLIIGGPYATQTEAYNACYGLPTSTEPPVTTPPPTNGITPPPPPPPQPPPPPPPPEPPPQPIYYCVTRTNAIGAFETAVIDASQVDQYRGDGWDIRGGPYASQADANLQCFGIPTTTAGKCSPFVLPELQSWCSTDICTTIDAIINAVKDVGKIDIFKFIGAGSLEDMAPVNTWMYGLKKIPLVGDAVYSGVTTVLCALNSAINLAIGEYGPDTAAWYLANRIRFIAGALQKWTGGSFTDIYQRASYFANYQSPTLIPSVIEADQAWLTGFINEQQWSCWVRANNVCPDPHKLIVSSGLWHPELNTTERLYRAGSIGPDEYNKLLRWNRVADDYTTELVKASYTQYPGFQDVIRFMVRDVWDAQVVAAGEYDAEFTEKYSKEAKRYGSISGIPDDLALLYWRAHWVLPSTSQTYEMLHRLRPGRVDPGLIFNVSDAVQLLGINDNAPGYRERLIAISYRPLPIRALRTLYDTAQIDTNEVGERYQDMGYSATDADLFSKQEEILKKRRLASQGQGFTPNFLAKALSLGAVSTDFVKQEMFRLGYDNDTADRLIQRASLNRQIQFALAGERRAMVRAQASTLSAYQVGAIPRDQALSVFQTQGFSERAASVLLDAQDLASRTQLVRQAVGVVRRSLMQGIINLPQAAQQLTAVGVFEPRLSEYIASWTLELTPKRRYLSRNEILKLTRDGILTADQAGQRLQNLGFGVDDVELMLLEIAYQRTQAELRVKTSLDKQRQKAAAALLRESERIKTLADKTRVQLCRKTPVSTLRRWYAGEVIDKQYVVESLSCQGYSPEQINGFLTEFEAARFERKAKKASLVAEASAESKAEGNGAGSTPTTGGG